MMGFQLPGLLWASAYSLYATRDLLVVVHPRLDEARPFIAALCIAFMAFAVLSWRYFFIAPLVVEATVALLLGFAYAASRKPA